MPAAPRKPKEKIQFRLDPQTMELLEEYSKRAGLTANSYAKEATLEKMAQADADAAALQQIADLKRLNETLFAQNEMLMRKLSVATEAILTAVSGDHQGAKTWVEQNMPRKTANS